MKIQASAYFKKKNLKPDNLSFDLKEAIHLYFFMQIKTILLFQDGHLTFFGQEVHPIECLELKLGSQKLFSLVRFDFLMNRKILERDASIGGWGFLVGK